ncbi:MAG TPA: 50S ribosomal protein L32 [Niabella sp.]|nr:50S ribosomal protein L32 [Niabella sp.]
MPNPKRRHSQQRSAKRRTHYKAVGTTLSTGEVHVRHRAHVSEGKLIYKGKVVAEQAPSKA